MNSPVHLIHFAFCVAATFMVVMCAGSFSLADDANSAKVSRAVVDAKGVRVHSVESPYQAGSTKVLVLLPDRFDASRKYRVLYVLPVEAVDGVYWGNALDEIKRNDLHNKHQLICVYPTFSHVPWYGDHANDKAIRQESYLLNVVVPFVDREYATVAEANGRLLVGFSKSGWGAFSLLLRNPKVFGTAVAWDAPFSTDKIDRFQIREIFGTQENFENYRITALLEKRGKALGDNPRLILAGANAFDSEHKAAHELMTKSAIPHVYFESPKHKHAWNGGWLPKAVELVAGDEN